MAPIHNEQSYSMRSSSSSARPFSCSCRGALSDNWEWFLPITKRGHFFQDSFFENTRSHFDAAVRDVLGRWDENLLTDAFHDTTNNFNRYRQLRSRELKEENQAVTVSSDSNSHKITLDVNDFMDGDVKVKVIGEKEVLVEGQIEQKRVGESSVSLQKFSRRFLLPDDTNVEAISSVMSSDGILTIVTPKKTNISTQETGRIILHKEASTSSASQGSKTAVKSTQKNNSATSTCTEAQETRESEKYCENCNKKLQSGKTTSQTSRQENIQIPVQNCTTKKTANMSSQNTYQANAVSEDMSKSKVESCQSESKNQTYSSKASENNVSAHETEISTDNTSLNIPIAVNFSSLPITRRGLFFNDSIFESSRNDFLNAVQEVLSRWGERSSLMDDLTCYRNLRTRDLREENQAVKVKEDESSHKFVLDVHDFMNGGEVNVKAISEREIVVEGHIENKEGGAKSMKRFLKRFVVPGDIQLESVTSVMSADGVLTITASKKLPTIQIRDVTSPTRTENLQESTSQRKLESEVRFENKTRPSEATSLENKHDTCESASSRSFNSAAASDVHMSNSSQKNSSNEHNIPVHVEGLTHDVKVDRMSQISKNSSDSGNFNEVKIKNNSASSGSHQVSIDKKSESNAEECRRDIKSQQKSTMTNSKQENHTNGNLSCSSGRFLPITRRGSFLSDSFFEDSRQSFQKAVHDVLQKFNEKGHSDDVTAYRGLRQQNITFENQACNVQENESSHKVVVDARDFIDGDIAVSVVGEKELVIEGRSENKKDASSSSLSFCRRFLLPGSVDIHAITSAISSDGILTVESPKKNGSSLHSNVKKMSSEAHGKQESHIDNGHLWEEKSTKESSEQAEGYSSRSVSKSYRSHQEQTITNAF